VNKYASNTAEGSGLGRKSASIGGLEYPNHTQPVSHSVLFVRSQHYEAAAVAGLE